MRKLVYGINMSLDGCCDHTKFGGGDDIHNYFRELLEDADLIIYGRKTYELMVPFWPQVAQTQSMDATVNAFAKTFAGINRVLVSRTITHTDDERTTIINKNVREEILKLKQQPGKAISIGGVELPAQLIEWGLVDEFHIVVHPVMVGQGRRLFTEMHLPENLGLKLSASQTLSRGCVALRYDKV
ncbi:dihydrofolate reductase family protein [Mucilaginibacter segetis]|uniref:Dihydrofolate reductase family protein n=1 Tax=Mucilaginibacter segetis TaxID=2793071 RepID=A0A934UPM9_9SPHI|nr:dihydrofolate reductase family protein [Mucilaginibacter segetis]MBK0381127.1 dihydrofolate reductase family protein [Mucilaginibacter segetis]